MREKKVKQVNEKRVNSYLQIQILLTADQKFSWNITKNVLQPLRWDLTNSLQTLLVFFIFCWIMGKGMEVKFRSLLIGVLLQSATTPPLLFRFVVQTEHDRGKPVSGAFSAVIQRLFSNGTSSFSFSFQVWFCLSLFWGMKYQKAKQWVPLRVRRTWEKKCGGGMI